MKSRWTAFARSLALGVTCASLGAASAHAEAPSSAPATPAPPSAATAPTPRVEFGPDVEPLIIGSAAGLKTVSLVMRPEVCIAGNVACQGTLFTVGFELRFGWFGFGLRGGTGGALADSNSYDPYGRSTDSKVTASIAALDLRFAFDTELMRRLWLTPFIDMTCSLGFATTSNGKDHTNMRLGPRPGLRVGYALLPYLSVFVEPIALQISLYTQNGGSSMMTDISYGLAFGVSSSF